MTYFVARPFQVSLNNFQLLTNTEYIKGENIKILYQ